LMADVSIFLSSSTNNHQIKIIKFSPYHFEF